MNPVTQRIRNRILAPVRSRPGITQQEVYHLLGITKGRARHHLQTLETERLVRSQLTANRRHYYPTPKGAHQ